MTQDEYFMLLGKHRHAMIDRLLESKQLEAYWKAEEMRLLKALDGQVK